MRKFAGIYTKYRWVQRAGKVSATHLRCIKFSKPSLLVFCTYCEIFRLSVNDVLLVLLTVVTAGAALFAGKTVEAMILLVDSPFSSQK